MLEIGATLREARERRGVTLADAAEATLIRARHLAALEEERFAELPGDAYVRSFLREYADFLGLDGQQLVAEYDLRFAKPEPLLVAPVSFQRRRRLGRSWPIALLTVVVVAIIALAVFVPVNGRRTSSKPSTPARRPPPPALARQPARPPRPALPHLRLVAARGDCWLEIHAGAEGGPLLYEGILRAGSSLTFVRRFLWIRIGAPTKLDIRLSGKLLPVAPTPSPINVRFALRRLRVVP